MTSSERQDAPLQEYSSCDEQVSRIDNIVWHTASIIFPISLAGLAYFGLLPNYTLNQLIVLSTVALGSVLLLIMWLRVSRQWYCYQAIAFYRMRELETELGLWHYRYSLFMRESNKERKSEIENLKDEEKAKFEKLESYIGKLPRFRTRARQSITIIAIVLMIGWIGLVVWEWLLAFRIVKP